MAQWQIRPYHKLQEEEYQKQLGDRLIARLLSARNVPTEYAETFLKSPYDKLSHPYSLKGVEEAAKIFIENAKKKGQVLIVGDYDCDGVVSSAMVQSLCRHFQVPCKVFLPSRLEHGYGLSAKTVKAIKEKINVKPELLIVLDCGVNSKDEINHLKKEMGISKTIVIDHHEIDMNRLAKVDALVNWHLSEGTSETCACGEVYHFIRGIREAGSNVDPIEFMTLAAVGIVGDVSPIYGDNRIIVKHGLGDYAMNHMHSCGLHALMDQAKLTSSVLMQQDVAFKIVPKINAAGRLHTPDLAYALMTAEDLSVAEGLAKELEDFNSNRKTIQKRIFKAAAQQVEQNPSQFDHGILLVNPQWHVGVVGIVASQLSERFNRPAIVVGGHNDKFKGSGRSIEGFDLRQAIEDEAKELFDEFGGHQNAVGVALNKDMIEKAAEVFNRACRKVSVTKPVAGVRYYDAELKPTSASWETSQKLLDTLYPYDNNLNPEPVFLLKDYTICNVDYREGTGWSSIKFNVEKNGQPSDMRFIQFSPKHGSELDGGKADVYFSFPSSGETVYGMPEAMVADIKVRDE